MANPNPTNLSAHGQGGYRHRDKVIYKEFITDHVYKLQDGSLHFQSGKYPDLESDNIVLSFDDPTHWPALWKLFSIIKDSKIADEIRMVLLDKESNIGNDIAPMKIKKLKGE